MGNSIEFSLQNFYLITRSLVYNHKLTILCALLIFLSSFVLISTFTDQGLYADDSWITLNQLHQLDQGDQLIYNEGKYGFDENNTPNQYFVKRGNILMYSLFLPILSYPALKIIQFWGDFYQYFIFTIWTLALIAIALLINKYFPDISICNIRNRAIYWPNLLIIISIIIYLLNLAVFFPQYFTQGTAPYEIPAVILTDNLLFASLAVVCFFIYQLILCKRLYSVMATFATIACSSYLIWGSCAKDHMLVAFLLSLVLYCFIRYLKFEKKRSLFFGFIFIGLVAWARPEVGWYLLIFSTLWLFLNEAIMQRSNFSWTGYIKSTFIPPLFTIVGAIPFFLNNYLLTGNLLKPVWYLYEEFRATVNYTFIDASNLTSFSISASEIISNASSAAEQIGIGKTICNIFSIIFLTGSNSISLLGVCPLLFFGLIMLAYYLVKEKQMLTTFDREVVLLLIIIGIGILLIYFDGIDSMLTSTGMGPDLRYYSPLYLPGSILGVIMLRYILKGSQLDLNHLKKISLLCILTSIIVLCTFIFLVPFDLHMRLDYILFSIIPIVFMINTLQIFYLNKRFKIPISYLYIPLSLMILFPLLWQIENLILLASSRFENYGFWLPIMSEVYPKIPPLISEISSKIITFIW
ncbi:MAG: hypothetical protein JXR87_04835 [Candidatus Marinimicrobia bacterium]|nr:hypothetical protein [Candidatus Neomarinimicrobiota bacterium]